MSVEGFEVRLGLSHALGAYLAINALPDSLIVMDGKDCVIQKTSQIQAITTGSPRSCRAMARIGFSPRMPCRKMSGRGGMTRSSGS